ncbi:MAG: hypothetical protein ACE5GC_01550, partial [Acidimicrobiia bacterium]
SGRASTDIDHALSGELRHGRAFRLRGSSLDPPVGDGRSLWKALMLGPRCHGERFDEHARMLRVSCRCRLSAPWRRSDRRTGAMAVTNSSRRSGGVYQRAVSRMGPSSTWTLVDVMG